jgi:C4-dicarboxylate transporter, DctM subunit
VSGRASEVGRLIPVEGAARAEPRGPLARLENGVATAILAAMTALPLLEMTGRFVLGRGFIPGAVPVVQHLMLWATLVGALLAARSDRLLALATAAALPEKVAPWVRIAAGAVGAGVTAGLAAASLDLLRIEWRAGDRIAWGIPVWVAIAAMPLAFAGIAWRLVRHASERKRRRWLAAIGLLLPLLFVPGLDEPAAAGSLLLPALAVLGVATLLGMPIFAGIGGAALVLFLADGTPANAVPGEAYNLSTNAVLPAIPLFALGGLLLAEGGSSVRLTRLFTALFGWLPGGLAVAVTVVLAFFTPLTGASGITIVSMGGLLLPVLTRSRYPEATSIGLVTVSGSIGLLFFPSLPVILYGFYANVPIERLFVGGLLPGLLLVGVVAGWGALSGVRHGAERPPFDRAEARSAVWEAKWEILLPLVVLGFYFGGLATLVEAAALSVLYSFVLVTRVHRDLEIRSDTPKVFVRCAGLIGGFMIILCVALSFTDYLILTDVPFLAVDWVQAHIESRWVFLLALNLLLILVGAMMDIYSAIIVVVPLIYPMAEAYGVDPVHLGILFLANMELGYLMPPMGENLFLAAYRFEQPLGRIYRSILPYALLLLIAVLVITFVPALTLWPTRLLGEGP